MSAWYCLSSRKSAKALAEGGAIGSPFFIAYTVPRTSPNNEDLP
ncbi:hypothetical protein [Escherichia phage vB-Eco-KMB41]|nr:hypothetical protein [Escherichia phage vB-Eco-KMB41]